MDIKTITITSSIPTISHESGVVCEDSKKEYYFRDNVNAGFVEYHEFPILLNDDGTQWFNANRYLLWKVKMNPRVDHKTLYGIAWAMKDFNEFCNSEEIDYLSAPRKIQRPPWLYREYLFFEVELGNLKHSTIRSRLAGVAGFYEWLIEVRGINFKYPMWKKDLLTMHYVNDFGSSLTKTVESKDLSRISVAKNLPEDSEYVMDGGRLKPLTEKEQNVLLEALVSLGNSEMFYGFLIAWFTGARMQTVFTLRLKHFQQEVLDEDGEIKVLVGAGTLCDTKGDRVYNLFFPAWLYAKIKNIYMNSERAKRRRSKALERRDMGEYLFLTRDGKPFYVSKTDIKKKIYDKAVTGEAVRQFLYKRLAGWTKEKGHKLKFTFHDLRATFAVNFLFADSDEEYDNIDLRKRLGELSVRMGHGQILTTNGYIKFRDIGKKKRLVQRSFEEKARKVLNDRQV